MKFQHQLCTKIYNLKPRTKVNHHSELDGSTTKQRWNLTPHPFHPKESGCVRGTNHHPRAPLDKWRNIWEFAKELGCVPIVFLKFPMKFHFECFTLTFPSLRKGCFGCIPLHLGCQKFMDKFEVKMRFIYKVLKHGRWVIWREIYGHEWSRRF